MNLFNSNSFYIFLEFFGGLFILLLTLSGIRGKYANFKKGDCKKKDDLINKNQDQDNYKFIFSSEFDNEEDDTAKFVFEIIGLFGSFVVAITFIILGIQGFIAMLK